jgi:Mg2+-importing ATPase
MLPIQILLNNLIYDVSELGLPFDRVDDADLAVPKRWDVGHVQRFMLTLGPVSSLFDFLTFWLLLHVLRADEALFHTGWFVESMATQILVIFLIRTRGAPWRSRPSPWLLLSSLGCLVLAIGLTLSPWGPALGFVAPPGRYFLLLALMLIAYLGMAEGVKRWFYRHLDRPHSRMPGRQA